MTYTVQLTKSFRGMEGYGFNAYLLRDGKRVCFVIDEGCGGSFLYEWVDHKAPKVDVVVRHWQNDAETLTHKGTPEEALFAKFIFDMKQDVAGFEGKDGETIGIKMTDDIWIGEQIEKQENAKRAIAACKRRLKAALVFQVDGELRSIPFKKAPMDKAREYVANKYKGKDVKVLNDMPIEEATAILVKVE